MRVLRAFVIDASLEEVAACVGSATSIGKHLSRSMQAMVGCHSYRLIRSGVDCRPLEDA